MNPPLPPCLRLTTYQRQRPTGPDAHDSPVRSRLNEVHDYFRQLIEEVIQLIGTSTDADDLHAVRGRLTSLACRQYCTDLISHHVREDTDIFPTLAEINPELSDVLARLEAEHTDMHHAIQLAYDRTRTVSTRTEREELRSLIHALAEIAESHFQYEEHELGRAMNTVDRVGSGAPASGSADGTR